jgi:hypothetical protein
MLAQARIESCSDELLDHPENWYNSVNCVIENTEIGYLASLMTPAGGRVVSIASGLGMGVFTAVKLGKSMGVCVDDDVDEIDTSKELLRYSGIDTARISYVKRHFDSYASTANFTREDTILAVAPHEIEDGVEALYEKTLSQYLLFHCHCGRRIEKHEKSAQRLDSENITLYETTIRNNERGRNERYPVLIKLRDSLIF